jgi:hypothetical protein
MNINFGTDVYQWWVFLKVVILLLILYWIWRSVWKLIQATRENPDTDDGKALQKGKINNFINHIVAKSFLLIVAFLFLFVFFGPGEVTTPVPVEEEGYYQQIQDQEGLPPDSVLEQQAEDSKPYELKRQDDPSFQVEREEADKYIEEALEQAKEYDKK